MSAARTRKSRAGLGRALAHPLHRDAAMVRQLLFVAAVLPATAACDDSNGDCSGTQVEKKLTVTTPADPPLQLKVDSCRVDVDACPALCALAMQRTQIGYPVDTCSVGFTADEVVMNVRYTVYGNDCFFADDVATPGGF